MKYKFIIFLIFLFSILINQEVVEAKEHIVTDRDNLQNVFDHADDGDVIILKKGLYEGNFVINRTITVKGESGATLKGPYEGDVLTVNVDDVVIENLQIEGSGSQNAGIYVKANRNKIMNNKVYNVFNGIQIRDGYANEVSENMVTGFKDNQSNQGFGIYLINAPHSKVSSNYLYDTNDGIYISFSDLCEISYNVVKQARYGIHTMDSKDIAISQNHISQSRNGLMIMQSDYVNIKENILENNTTIDGAGMFIFDTFDSKISANVLKKNNIGIYLENAMRNQVMFNKFEENDKGLEIATDSYDNQIALNNFLGNNHQVISDKENENYFEWLGSGNYWDDYHHLDTDQNGLNDYAYKSGDVFYNLTSKEAYLQIFSASPAVRLWNTVEQFVPIPSDQFIIDDHPLMKQVNVKLEATQIAKGTDSFIAWQSFFFFGVSFLLGITIMVLTRRKKHV